MMTCLDRKIIKQRSQNLTWDLLYGERETETERKGEREKEQYVLTGVNPFWGLYARSQINEYPFPKILQT